jgi:glycine cleavage system aminomethyltransferase T
MVNEDADSISFDEVLAEQIDELIAEDENAKGGASYKVWRPEAFARINDLTTIGAMSVENAIDKVLDKLAERGDYVHVGRSQIGMVTSGMRSPLLKKNISLCRLSVEYSDIGTEVEIGKLDGHIKRIPATVVALPFYDPEKNRPRS